MRLSRSALILAAALVTGCAPTNIAEWQQALGNDPATFCIHVTSVYGQAKVARSACTNCKVSCTADGLTIQQVAP